jgi:hypothetical protein
MHRFLKSGLLQSNSRRNGNIWSTMETLISSDAARLVLPFRIKLGQSVGPDAAFTPVFLKQPRQAVIMTPVVSFCIILLNGVFGIRRQSLRAQHAYSLKLEGIYTHTFLDGRGSLIFHYPHTVTAHLSLIEPSTLQAFEFAGALPRSRIKAPSLSSYDT